MKTSITILLSLIFIGSVEARLKLPSDYQSRSGCEKQGQLWAEIERTQHSDLPEFHKFGALQLLGMTVQQLTKKKALQSDVAPKKWKKFLHRRGSIAKVKIVPTVENKYTGVFTGAECALLRLSITYKPSKKRKFAPGLALKVLRDGTPSANISALYRLDGQGDNFNFFENSLSNIVPIGTEIGLKLVHSIFRRVTDYPEELLVNDFAQFDSKGEKIMAPRAPRQIFFLPNPKLEFSSKIHDVRDDFHKIPNGTLIYSVYALPEKYQNYDYYNYENENAEDFLKESVHIADIFSTSPFISSEFGDTGIFFRHETRAKK